MAAKKKCPDCSGRGYHRKFVRTVSADGKSESASVSSTACSTCHGTGEVDDPDAATENETETQN